MLDEETGLLLGLIADYLSSNNLHQAAQALKEELNTANLDDQSNLDSSSSRSALQRLLVAKLNAPATLASTPDTGSKTDDLHGDNSSASSDEDKNNGSYDDEDDDNNVDDEEDDENEDEDEEEEPEEDDDADGEGEEEEGSEEGVNEEAEGEHGSADASGIADEEEDDRAYTRVLIEDITEIEEELAMHDREASGVPTNPGEPTQTSSPVESEKAPKQLPDDHRGDDQPDDAQGADTQSETGEANEEEGGEGEEEGEEEEEAENENDEEVEEEEDDESYAPKKEKSLVMDMVDTISNIIMNGSTRRDNYEDDMHSYDDDDDDGESENRHENELESSADSVHSDDILDLHSDPIVGSDSTDGEPVVPLSSSAPSSSTFASVFATPKLNALTKSASLEGHRVTKPAPKTEPPLPVIPPEQIRPSAEQTSTGQIRVDQMRNEAAKASSLQSSQGSDSLDRSSESVDLAAAVNTAIQQPPTPQQLPTKDEQTPGSAEPFKYPVRAEGVVYDSFELKVVFPQGHTGFEPTKDFPIEPYTIVAGRYQIIEYLDSAAFSRAIRAVDLHNGNQVCMKIIKNNKDFFDQSLDEIKLLKYLNRKGDPDIYHILRLYDFFYFKEHLFLVCELLRDNLYEFYKYTQDHAMEHYFTINRLQKITMQCLVALQFIHKLGIVHTDLKPENILIKSYSRCEVKIIDFGSSCFLSDHLGSYVQSRAYRAPEVLLGLPYDQKIDIWSLGCIIAELHRCEVLLHNSSVSTLLARLIAVIGDVPQEMLERGRYAPKYFTRKRGLLFERSERDGAYYYLYPSKDMSLRAWLQTDDEEFIDFMQSLLTIQPSERPTASEALTHPWLSKVYPPI